MISFCTVCNRAINSTSILFNDRVEPLSPNPSPATAENVERALGFVKSSTLGGGTDLNQALLRAVELADSFPPGERSVALISDANPTLKTVSLKRIARAFDQANASDEQPKTTALRSGRRRPTPIAHCLKS